MVRKILIEPVECLLKLPNFDFLFAVNNGPGLTGEIVKSGNLTFEFLSILSNAEIPRNVKGLPDTFNLPKLLLAEIFNRIGIKDALVNPCRWWRAFEQLFQPPCSPF